MSYQWPSIADPTIAGPFAFIVRASFVPVVFFFPINPQFARVMHPARGQIHQTLGNNWLDDFGGPRSVLSKCILRGTFGQQQRLGGIGLPLSGNGHLRTLEAVYETFNSLDRALKARAGMVTEFVNVGRQQLWRVWIESLSYDIRSTDPLLYYYDISFTRLEDYLSPVGSSLTRGIGDVGTRVLGMF